MQTLKQRGAITMVALCGVRGTAFTYSRHIVANKPLCPDVYSGFYDIGHWQIQSLSDSHVVADMNACIQLYLTTQCFSVNSQQD